MAVERELSKDGEGETCKGGMLRTANAVWDETGNFILYPSLLGIKGEFRPTSSCSRGNLTGLTVVNTVTNRVSRVLGMSETARWLNLSLYQGAPAKKGLTTLAMAASANPLLQDKSARDPTLFCTAYKKQRFYIFSRSEPEDSKEGDRDIFNEKPTREEQSIALAAQPAKNQAALGTSCVIHTTKGDIVSIFVLQKVKI